MEQAMSVTFYPAQYVSDPQRGVVLDCVDVREDIPVNLANANAVRVLEILGFPPERDEQSCDFVGASYGAVAFLGRVLLALELAPYDEEMPVYQLPGDGCLCGRALGTPATCRRSCDFSKSWRPTVLLRATSLRGRSSVGTACR
jgi:hypothetical protein